MHIYPNVIVLRIKNTWHAYLKQIRQLKGALVKHIHREITEILSSFEVFKFLNRNQ